MSEAAAADERSGPGPLPFAAPFSRPTTVAVSKRASPHWSHKSRQSVR
jgi:hypothetical protein